MPEDDKAPTFVVKQVADALATVERETWKAASKIAIQHCLNEGQPELCCGLEIDKDFRCRAAGGGDE